MKIRLFLEQELSDNLVVPLDKKQSHYLNKVLRCKENDEIFVFDDKNGEFSARIIEIGKQSVISVSARTKNYKTPLPITLAFAPVKNVKTEFIALKATELNIYALKPIITSHSIVRKINEDRLIANIIEAAEQSESVYIPKLQDTTKLYNFLNSLTENDILIFCDESRIGKRANKLFAEIPKTPNLNFYILIGPEGGFSTDERESIASTKNCYNLSLGEKILRADTAAISAIALFNDFFNN